MACKLFGSSGIRGLVNEELTPDLAVKIGYALGEVTEAGYVLIARDTRTSGLMLEKAITSGLIASGAQVQLLGIQPTPVLAYLTRKLKADAGVMITASHNPPQYNGIKIFDESSASIDEEKQSKIEEILRSGVFKLASWRDLGQAIYKDESQEYVEMLLNRVKLDREWRLIVDPGCGATSEIAPTIFRKSGCKVVAINAQMDGFFPGRKPEPNFESLGYLAKTVKSLGADVGIAFDGDGDRVAFIDEKGNFVSFDRVLAVYASNVVEKSHGGIVATNVEASMSIEELVESKGGKVVRTKVGDVYVARAVKKHNAVFGGEPCGAWIHPEFHYCPDGILSALLLLRNLEERDQKLSEFIAEAIEHPMLRENIPCPNELKYEVLERAEKHLLEILRNYREVSKVDGVRISTDDGWILIRASGTEPLIRVTVEGVSSEKAKSMMETALASIRKAEESLKE